MMEYTLQSSGLVHAPGFVRWLRAMHETGKRSDKVRAVAMLTGGWSLPKEAARYLLTCPEDQVKTEGEALTFTFPAC